MSSIDNVLMTFVCYGLNTSGVPSTVNAASVTFSEKEVVEAKDVLWETCKSNLDVDKTRRVASVNRTEKMAHLTDIVEASSELMSKNKMPRCITDAIGMARWPTFNNAVVSATNYAEMYKKLDEKFACLEKTVASNTDRITKMTSASGGPRHKEKPVHSKMDRNSKMDGAGGANEKFKDPNLDARVAKMMLGEQKVQATHEPSAQIDVFSSSDQLAAKSDRHVGLHRESESDETQLKDKTDEQGQEASVESYAAVLNIPGGGSVEFSVPNSGPQSHSMNGGNHGRNHSDGFKVQHSIRKVITGTGSGGKITSAMTTKRRSVFLSNLSVSVEDTDLSEHLLGCGVLGARFRKVSPRGATSKSYKVDVSEQYYDKLCNPEIWSEGVKLRDWNPY